MGTRGSYGFQKNGVQKMCYNHWSSYPSELGKDITEFLKDTSIKELNEIFNRIELVKEDGKPTPEQIEECKPFSDTSVSSGSLDEWYVLLRKAQGNLNVYREGLKYMIDSEGYMGEWSYIIDLDKNDLLVYEDGNLDAIFRLNDIPDNWWDDFE